MKLADDMSRAIKAATARLIYKAGGPGAAALVCRASPQVLYEYISPNRLDRVIPVHVAMQLETFVGEAIVTGTLARLQGYTLARPDADAAQDIGRTVAAVSRLAGEATARFVEAASDGRIDTRERADLMRHAEQLGEAADAMKAALAGEMPALKVVA